MLAEPAAAGTRVRRRRTIGCAFAASAALLAGCGSSGSLEKSSSATTTTTAVTTTTGGGTGGTGGQRPTTVPDDDANPPAGSDAGSDAGFAALEAALIVTVPSGYEVQPDDVGDTGPSDLDKAVHDDGSPGARKTLLRDGFVRGYQRLWALGDDRQIIVFLYEFETPGGAAANAARMIPRLQAMPEVSRTFALDGVAGSGGAYGERDDTGGASLMFTRGPYEVQVVVNGPSGGDPTEAIGLVQRLGADQYARLPG